MQKVGNNPKYQFHYSQDDYTQKIEPKKSAQVSKTIDPNRLQEFYLEITPTTVKQVTDELSLSILKGIDEEKDLIYVRLAETGGHCIDLRNMRLINTINGKSRQIYYEIPLGKKLLQQNKKLQNQLIHNTIGLKRTMANSDLYNYQLVIKLNTSTKMLVRLANPFMNSLGNKIDLQQI